MIVIIVVLAVLAGVAVPRYVGFSDQARASATVQVIKTFGRALVQYRADMGAYPPQPPGFTLPPELASYFEVDPFSGPSPLGSRWWYDPPGLSGFAGPQLWNYVGEANPRPSSALLQMIDARIDDGNINNGRCTIGTVYGPDWLLVEFVP